MTSCPGNRSSGSRGYTLLELLTAIAIIALIGGLGAGAYQVARRNYAIQASAGHIQGILRAARASSISTGSSAVVVVDPASRTATAQAYERVGEWSFEDVDAEAPSGISVRVAVNKGGVVQPGRVGSCLSFKSVGSYYECGSEPRFDVRTGILITAWVRHGLVEPVKEPKAEPRKTSGSSRRRSLGTSARRGNAREESALSGPTAAIVKKDGAYFFGMTPGGALEGAIGSFAVRTDDGVVQPERWVYVEMRYDGASIELASDGVPRESFPVDGGGVGLGAKEPSRVAFRPGARDAAKAKAGGKDASAAAKVSTAAPAPPIGPPPAAPVTRAPLTISDAAQSFPGEIDEVRLGGMSEPLRYEWPEHERVLGWRKVIHFDRRGHLDPAYHQDPVRLVLVELPDETRKAAGATTTEPVVEYSLTFEDWVKHWDKPQELRQSEEEAKLERSFVNTRSAVIEVDRLGVIQ